MRFFTGALIVGGRESGLEVCAETTKYSTGSCLKVGMQHKSLLKDKYLIF